MFKEKQFSNLRLLEIQGKKIAVVDRHQYTLPIWAEYSLKNKSSYQLVSIDYHPDTNPPFYNYAKSKMAEKYFDDIEDKTLNFIKILMKRYVGDDLGYIIDSVEKLNNDEHIMTAIDQQYLSSYHMINCMDRHVEPNGVHYLVEKEYFSSLEDDMFKSVMFEKCEKPFILDIDLDYFLDKKSFQIKNNVFEKLVVESEIITIARSTKYFEYLKKEDFTVEECENLLIDYISKILKN